MSTDGGSENKAGDGGSPARGMGGLSWVFPLGKEGKTKRHLGESNRSNLEMLTVFQGWGAGWGRRHLDSEKETVQPEDVG